jgi:hypothetical protein
MLYAVVCVLETLLSNVRLISEVRIILQYYIVYGCKT